MEEVVKLKKMSFLLRTLALKKMSKEERQELRDMGKERFLDVMLSKKLNPYDRKSWGKMYDKL